ncbi:MAG: FeoA domain-containing protein [Candidatus Methylacidiphilales bacterium]|nr:FeoA domain-containing protein [Candidatus Methylacidiphilales bacterium]
MSKLSSLRSGQKAHLEDIGPDAVLAQRLMATGLMPGHEIDLQHKMPLGGPVLCRFPSGKLGIRHADAQKLRVKKSPTVPPKP